MNDKMKNNIKTAGAVTVAALSAAAVLTVSPISTNEPNAEETKPAAVETTEETAEYIIGEEEKTEDKNEKTEEIAEKESEPQTEAEEHLEVKAEDYSNHTLELGYSLVQNEYSETFNIDVPDVYGVDIAELYFNDCLVDTALLPNKTNFISIPFVFDDLGRLKIKFYKLGENIGSAVFKEGRLYTDLKGE